MLPWGRVALHTLGRYGLRQRQRPPRPQAPGLRSGTSRWQRATCGQAGNAAMGWRLPGLNPVDRIRPIAPCSRAAGSETMARQPGWRWSCAITCHPRPRPLVATGCKRGQSRTGQAAYEQWKTALASPDVNLQHPRKSAYAPQKPRRRARIRHRRCFPHPRGSPVDNFVDNSPMKNSDDAACDAGWVSAPSS